MAKRKPLTDKTVTYNPKAWNCDANHIYEMTIQALKDSGREDKIEEYERFISYGDHRHLIHVSKRYVNLVRLEAKTPPPRNEAVGSRTERKAKAEATKRYEVTISVRLHGTFTVEAKDERQAEEIVGAKFGAGEIKVSELEEADETRIDCVGEAEDDPPKHICPLSQQPCDEECSWDEKANCEFYQGLSAGRAEGK